MTGLLKDALNERAAAEEAPHLDLDAIVRTGDRQLRHRRALGGIGAAAAVFAVVAGSVVLLDRPSAETSPAGPPAPFAERKVTWSSGDTIHYGDRKIPVSPVTVFAFVQTDSGFVLVDRKGGVFVADGRQVTKIGAGNLGHRLKADDTGSMVGWVDFTPRVPEYVVYDVATRREVVRTAQGNSAKAVGTGPGMRPAPWPGAPVVAGIDDGIAYFAAGGPLAHGAGLYRWDIAAGRGELIKRGQIPEHVNDIAAGRFVIESDTGLVVSTDATASTPYVTGEYGDLSPRGTTLFVMTDSGSIFHEASGLRPLPVRRPGYARLAWSYWLDDDRLVALGIHEPDGEPIVRSMDLVTCSIRAAECVTSVPDVVRPDRDEGSPAFQLPIGWNLGEEN